MRSLIVRKVDDDLVKRLRARSAGHGCSAETEHREILRAALVGDEPQTIRGETVECLADFAARQEDAGLRVPIFFGSLGLSECRS
jgi:plasmid stability protein